MRRTPQPFALLGQNVKARHGQNQDYDGPMKKEQIARQLAKESRISPAAAADEVDRILSEISKLVRKGQSASLPGLGTFQAGRKEEFQFDQSIPSPSQPGPSKKGRP